MKLESKREKQDFAMEYKKKLLRSLDINIERVRQEERELYQSQLHQVANSQAEEVE